MGLLALLAVAGVKDPRKLTFHAISLTAKVKNHLDETRLNEYNYVCNHLNCFMRGADMNGYVRAEELAGRWNISVRQIQILCKAGKISGAIKFGNTWAIPEDAIKPTRTGNLKPGRKPTTYGVK